MHKTGCDEFMSLTLDSGETQMSPLKQNKWQFGHLDPYVTPEKTVLRGSVMAIIFIANLLLVLYF